MSPWRDVPQPRYVPSLYRPCGVAAVGAAGTATWSSDVDAAGDAEGVAGESSLAAGVGATFGTGADEARGEIFLGGGAGGGRTAGVASTPGVAVFGATALATIGAAVLLRAACAAKPFAAEPVR